MPLEIERKFLIGDSARLATVLQSLHGTHMRQGYLAQGNITVRVRITDTQAWLTLKSATVGLTRSEFEYPIPIQDADALLTLSAGPVLAKTRYRVPVDDHVFEVDVFHGAIAPLVIAEVELRSEHELFMRPDWLGTDVSHDPQYRNSDLVKRLSSGTEAPAP